ncbi:MAG: hypothetical protein DRP87_17525 [Spirochaetes bacterium]|nr:MAG: hypothetical protein DRP87_17525 [Spirochaetota bacterium]
MRKLGIQLDEYGFVKNDPFQPWATNFPGVFAQGTLIEPIDIPETASRVSAASARVIELLCDVRGSLIRPKEYPQERKIYAGDARIGIFVCHCGKNIGGLVNITRVLEYIKTLPHVV